MEYTTYLPLATKLRLIRLQITGPRNMVYFIMEFVLQTSIKIHPLRSYISTASGVKQHIVGFIYTTIEFSGKSMKNRLSLKMELKLKEVQLLTVSAVTSEI